MAVSRITKSSILQGFPKSRSLLAGNAAFIPNSYESIATATGTGSSATITFSSIPSTYSHLQIRVLSKSSTGGATYSNLSLRINGITSSSYTNHWLYGQNAAITVQSDSTNTRIYGMTAISGSNAVSANCYGVAIIDIIDYASTTKNKTIRLFSGFNRNSASEDIVQLGSGALLTTNAISSITLFNDSGFFFDTTSTFALYGIKG